MTKPGPKPFSPSKAQRQHIELCVACGMTEDAIAQALGVATNTLRTHCADELQLGRGRARLRILGMLSKSAEAGNVSAQKKLEELSRLSDADASARGEDAPRPAARGKKEQAQDEAVTAGAGTDWGDDLNPTARPN